MQVREVLRGSFGEDSRRWLVLEGPEYVHFIASQFVWDTIYMGFSSSFVPAGTGLSDDQPKRCAVLLKGTISSTNAELVSPFPENISE